MPLEPGFLLKDRYKIETILGEGGMGAVYRALDIEDNNLPVAVKEFRLKHLPTDAEVQRKASTAERKNAEEIVTREKALDQFKHEAEMLASLDHPNLPKVTDYFEVRDNYFLVMTLIVGKDASTVLASLNGKPLPDRVVLVWIKQVMDALVYCHSKGVIHRDIKPANIILTNSGRVFLVDFGIAKISSATKRTSIGARVVSPGYSPPEQYSLGRTDFRSDVYSIGATMFAMLTGIEPVDAINRLMGTRLPDPHELNPTISLLLEAEIIKATSLQQEERYQTIIEFQNAVFSTRGRISTPPEGSRIMPLAQTMPLPKPENSRLPASQPVSVSQPVQAALQKESEKSKPRGLLQSLFGGKEDISAPVPPEVESLRKKSSDIELNEPIQQLSWAPAGNSLGILTGHGIYNYDGQNVKPIWQVDSGWAVNRHRITMSADGTLLASGMGYRVHVWSLLNNQKVSDFTINEEFEITGVVFMYNGTLLTSGASLNSGTFKVWDSQNRRELLSLEAEDRMVGSAVFSKSGKLVAINYMGTASGGKRDGIVKVWDLPGRREMGVLSVNGTIVSSLDFSPDDKMLAVGSGMVSTRKNFIVSRIPTAKDEVFSADHAAVVTRVAFSPAGDMVASVADNGTVKVWSLAEKCDLIVDTIDSIKDATCVDFLPTGNRLTIGTASGIVCTRRFR